MMLNTLYETGSAPRSVIGELGSLHNVFDQSMLLVVHRFDGYLYRSFMTTKRRKLPARRYDWN